MSKETVLGQQYRTPDQVIRESGCDVIIVGRGIYGPLMTERGKKDKKAAFVKVREQGERYKKAGWEAYLARMAEVKQTSPSFGFVPLRYRYGKSICRIALTDQTIRGH